MFAGLGEVVGHKDDKSQSARLAADLFLIGGAEPLYAHGPRDGLRQYLQQGDASDYGKQNPPRGSPMRGWRWDLAIRHRSGEGSQDRTKLAIRRRMVMVRPESSQTDVNTRASRILRSA